MEIEETYLQQYICQLVIYQNYHDGFEKIEGAHQTLLDGLHNLKETVDSFKNVYGQITSSWIPKFKAYANTRVPASCLRKQITAMYFQSYGNIEF